MIPDAERISFRFSNSGVDLFALSAPELMLVVGRGESFSARQLSSQVLRLMDHHRQALRAKMVGFSAVFKGQERDFIGIAPAVQTGFFIHGFLLIGLVPEYTLKSKKPV